MKFNFGDFVWLNGSGWRFCGMDMDGCIHVCRPMEAICFDIVEFDYIYPTDTEDYDQFCRDNGESLSESCTRRAIEAQK